MRAVRGFRRLTSKLSYYFFEKVLTFLLTCDIIIMSKDTIHNKER